MEIVNIIMPATITFVLFGVTIFGVILPTFEDYLIGQKKIIIAAETERAYEKLVEYHQRAESGALPLEEAKRAALSHVGGLRYGRDGKDYFWVNDLQAKLLVHPYRRDLEGDDLSRYQDRNGKFVFKEFVEIVEANGAGYLAYLWQWKDEPERVIPKISYVKIFESWGWVVGTGVYLDDVKDEISILTAELIIIVLAIVLVIFILALLIIRNGIKERAKRLLAEKELYKYQEDLEDLVARRTKELKKTQEEVKILSGFLPICASCKKIRDDNGYWTQIESYIRDHSEAEFSHGICPECVKKLYPEYCGPEQSSEITG